MEIRVTIFEDNKIVRDALEAIFNGSPGFHCSGTFADASMVEERIRSTNPGVVMMDIEMPGLNGIQATKIIHDVFPEVKVLIQTVYNDSTKIFQALCAGASGYILKNDPSAKQIEAVQEVYQGGAVMSPSIARKVMEFFSHQNVMLAEPENSDYNLSEREKEILKLMAQGHNYRGIAEKAFISYETVKSHIKKIYKKLHVTSRTEALLKARQQRLT
jgi:DNA-binding NarL/FixJ family response regulator